ncbi:hypothetical protein GCM10010193_16790 [Kitasatospora atroaurantiaca]|uniref:hypothetical protein n=1 Tax=Kitasatospora atroaurantiaca TaxID=285545 RepID=UPI00337A4A80
MIAIGDALWERSASWRSSRATSRWITASAHGDTAAFDYRYGQERYGYFMRRLADLLAHRTFFLRAMATRG